MLQRRIRVGWQRQEKNGVRLHHATYCGLRQQFPNLPTQLVVAARVRATEALKSTIARKKKGYKASCPTAALVPIRYDARKYSIKFRQGIVSLSSVAGRLKVPFVADSHAQNLLDQAVGFDSADLIRRKGRFWLHVVVTLLDVEFQPSGEVVGVDMGLARPAVASNNRFLGKKRWREIDRRYFRLKRALQAKGTRSAKRHLRKLAGKETCSVGASSILFGPAPRSSWRTLDISPGCRPAGAWWKSPRAERRSA